jgi:hypothetical protein
LESLLDKGKEDIPEIRDMSAGITGSDAFDSGPGSEDSI